MAVMSATMAGGMFGFLVHNAPPARVFMGDVGSIWIGFTFAGLAVLGAARGEERLSVGFWILLLGVFLLDTGLTLTRRVLKGEPVLQAHRTHYYQRLLRVGWGHRRVTGLYLIMAALLATVAVVHFDFVRLRFTTLVVIGLLTFGGTFSLVHYVEHYKAQLEAARGLELAHVVAAGLRRPMKRFLRRWGISMLLEAIIIVASYATAFLLRFAWDIGAASFFYLGLRDGIIAIVFVHLTLNAALGVYMRRIHAVSTAITMRYAAAAAVGGFALMVGEILLGPVRAIPLSVLGVGSMLSCTGFLVLRYLRLVKR